MKLPILCLCVILISGCSIFNKDRIVIQTEVQEVQVPLLYCPAPPSIVRPVLELNELTDAQFAHDGELAKAYAVTILQLIGYASELEQSLETYDGTNLAYEELRLQLEAELTENQHSRN